LVLFVVQRVVELHIHLLKMHHQECIRRRLFWIVQRLHG
jgi:hypothetical protein